MNVVFQDAVGHRVGGASAAVEAGPSPETGGEIGHCLETGTTNPPARFPDPEVVLGLMTENEKKFQFKYKKSTVIP
ncbi:hypothetical protein JZ751_023983 [Albula glossodonta]|uniref:Uncharacterized protein n=1 Tax=Albula glossodonta TaxID=121402 RepID=A0A8T2NFG2_9TELE|nr:hypothetical protein JZ751_023983 [Albula glossodonta]